MLQKCIHATCGKFMVICVMHVFMLRNVVVCLLMLLFIIVVVVVDLGPNNLLVHEIAFRAYNCRTAHIQWRGQFELEIKGN